MLLNILAVLLLLEEQVNATAKNFVSLILFSHTFPFFVRLEDGLWSTWFQAMVALKLDFYSTVPLGLPLISFQKFQYIQNVTVQLLSEIMYVIYIIQAFYWLPVSHRDQVTYKALNGLGSIPVWLPYCYAILGHLNKAFWRHHLANG